MSLWEGDVREFLIAMALVLGGCTAGGGAPPSTASSYGAAAVTDYGRLSLRLSPGMSEKDVIGLLGEPKKSDVSSCGGATSRPWQCKIWKYGEWPLSGGLAVYFGQNSTGAWVVSSWNNSPM
jgi:hypothetical protein